MIDGGYDGPLLYDGGNATMLPCCGGGCVSKARGDELRLGRIVIDAFRIRQYHG